MKNTKIYFDDLEGVFFSKLVDMRAVSGRQARLARILSAAYGNTDTHFLRPFCCPTHSTTQRL